jgi:hypothetical protein
MLSLDHVSHGGGGPLFAREALSHEEECATH